MDGGRVEEAEGINYFEEYLRQLTQLRLQYPDYHPAVIHIIADERTKKIQKKRTEDTYQQYYSIAIYQTPCYP